jgi:hypothetical protein
MTSMAMVNPFISMATSKISQLAMFDETGGYHPTIITLNPIIIFLKKYYKI